MLRFTKVTVAAIICFFFAFPLIRAAFFPRKGTELSGVTKRRKADAFSFQRLFSERYRHSLEQSFQRRTGLPGYLIKADNQLNVFLFRQLSSNPKFRVVLGRESELIERAYLRSANRTIGNNKGRLLATAKQLRKFQEALAKRGVEFLLVISPNKPTFSPEILPSWYRVPEIEKRLDAREFMLQKLDELKVHYIDGYSLLKQEQAKVGWPMFASSGTHWNELGGCTAASGILRESSKILKRALPMIDCTLSGKRGRPVYQDMDLLRLSNLWFPELLIKPAPNVRPVKISPPEATPPKILIIGSSFCWELLRQFERTRTISKSEFLYYFKRRFLSSKDRGREIRQDSFNFEKALAGKDLVLIEINQAFLKEAGFTFPRRFLEWDHQHLKK